MGLPKDGKSCQTKRLQQKPAFAGINREGLSVG